VTLNSPRHSSGSSSETLQAPEKRRRIIRGPTPESIEESVYIDKLRLANVPLLIDSDNAFGFHHENLIGSKKTMKLANGQTIWIKISDDPIEEDSVPEEGATEEEIFATAFRRAYATVDFNPSRFVFSNPAEGYINARQLPSVLDRAMPRQFEKLGIPRIDFNDLGVRIRSIDIARDFSVHGANIDTLFHDIRKNSWSRRPTLELINKAGEPDNTLRHRRLAYQIQLYDQKVCHGTDFPTDLRCELRVLRPSYPGSWDLRQTSSITPREVTRVLRMTFERRVPFGAQTSLGRLDFPRGELVK
jgi:hypothetical protein